MSKPTAILLNWKRPWNIPIITEFLEETDLFRDILVWDNTQENVCTFGRFLCAQKHSVSRVFTVDDDVLPLNVEELIDEYDAKRIWALLPDGNGSRHYRFQYVQEKKPWMMLGFGSIFEQEWAEIAYDKWMSHYPSETDILFSKWDRIFTILHGSENHRAIEGFVEKLEDPNGERSDTSKDALSRQPGHYDLVRKVTEMCMEIV